MHVLTREEREEFGIDESPDINNKRRKTPMLGIFRLINRITI